MTPTLVDAAPMQRAMHKPFSIIIVGGGIAGLCCAIALRHADRHITVLEQTEQNREVGATISLQPNATKIVEQQWGLAEPLKEHGAMVDRAFAVYGVDGELQMRIPLGTQEKYGAERVMHHRMDLHAVLKERATDKRYEGRPAVMRVRSRVVSCNAEGGNVTLESGELLTADLIVGADGIKSVVRSAVLGEEATVSVTGFSAYRFMVPVKELEAQEGFSEVIDPKSPQTTMVVGHDRRLIMGPARNASIFGVVALLPDENMSESSHDTSWVTRGSREMMLESFKVFPEWIKQLLRQAKDAGLWQLRDLDPLTTWYRGRTIIVGDAAHAMLPTQGQGASQAVEDAEALGAFFADIDGVSLGVQEIEKRNKVSRPAVHVRLLTNDYSWFFRAVSSELRLFKPIAGKL
jgi:salicylate hydroxylase